MLNHPTLDKLHSLRLTGMARAFEQHRNLPEIETLSFDERLGLMVDCEALILDRHDMGKILHASGPDETGCQSQP